jgi:hypothetical protein
VFSLISSFATWAQMISKLKKVSPTPEEAIVRYSPGFFKAAALAL